MSAEPMDMDVEETEENPLANDGGGGTSLTNQFPFTDSHVNTGVFSGHPGLQAFLTLGVPINASLAEIKAAYRKLARAYHPDKLNNSLTPQEQEAANARFSQINAAYNLLTQAYSQYDGKSINKENFPVFFGTPASLEAQKQPKERDPYELLRRSSAVDLPHTAPEHCIIPGDSSCLFRAQPDNVPLCLPYEAQPPPLPQVETMDTGMMEDVPQMKRSMDSDLDAPRQKRRRMEEPLFGGTSENTNMFNGKRDADQVGTFDGVIPPSKKQRMA